MAKSKDPKEMIPEGKSAEPKKKSEGGNKILIMLFSVVMIIQLVIIVVLVYFYINKPVAPPDYSQMMTLMQQQGFTENLNQQKNDKKSSRANEDYYDEDEEDNLSQGPLIMYQTDDLIINPKGARAGKYLMTQIGLSVLSEEVKKEFEDTRKAQIYDILNGYLASQSFEYLADITKRDSLKIELKQLLNKSIKGKKVKDVFFSKYIVQ